MDRLIREGIMPGDTVIQNHFRESPGFIYAPYIPIVCKVTPEMKPIMQSVLRHIAAIEWQHKVKVIYACESGSRAWGFPSVDSDYDVRFIYVNHPDWYMSLDDRRDVIEGKDYRYVPTDDDPTNLDVSGWDIKKTLTLLHKSNPPLLEWLESPIVYFEAPCKTVGEMRRLARETYNTTACIYHYLHMAQNNFREFLKGGEVWVKKYFYVLRPILAIKWLEEGHGIVPTEFQKLVDGLILGSYLRDAIAKLVEAKKNGAELAWGPRIPAISDFIEDELRRLERKGEYPTRSPSWDALNGLFRIAVESYARYFD